jgi:drug/metabolite transporter (DMT)-like permease
MIEQQKNNVKGSLILGAAALIWGLAFVAQSDAADKVPPFLFNSLRSFIAAIFLFGALWVRKLTTKQNILPQEPLNRKRVVTGGILCGILLTVSVNLQQAAITIYPAGAAAEARSGFLTALYVVFVPIIALFMGKKLELPILGAIVVATGGFYMLCLWDGIDSIYLADLLALLCAISFSFHILSVDRYSGFMNGMLLSMVQFLVCGALSGVISLVIENAVIWENVLSAAFPILYTGVMSSGVAYTMQIYGQKYAEPAVASLSMSLESVFAALGGWLIAGNALSLPEFIGCALVFLAIVLAQLPQLLETRKTRKKE